MQLSTGAATCQHLVIGVVSAAIAFVGRCSENGLGFAVGHYYARVSFRWCSAAYVDPGLKSCTYIECVLWRIETRLRSPGESGDDTRQSKATGPAPSQFLVMQTSLDSIGQVFAFVQAAGLLHQPDQLFVFRRSLWWFDCPFVERFVSGTLNQVTGGLLYAHLRHNALDWLVCQTMATARRHRRFLLCAGLNFPCQR
ncbi:uncharacterized protein BDZ83DRAFT_125341 [Colletotrichum acutatum]|uniref:Uncharacterized protein n=1 Tax=Glomerella acutata TaxID=27357 RepID=A0AAD8UDR8_GLOAC|nr:uncharacterized protein BDZ83DRAFT_125341 [Colletotrichum acutatum]KAK1710586.1 hypothetical protein BDZ83DRAFT_125341 [Colletotrichum acutatum]